MEPTAKRRAVAVGLALAGAAALFAMRPERVDPPGPRGEAGDRRAAPGEGDRDASDRAARERSGSSARARTARTAKGGRAPAPRGETVVDAREGSALGEIGVSRPSEGAPEGPMSFAVDGAGRAFVLDQVNSRVQVFAPGEEPRAIALPADTFQDIAVSDDGRAVVMDRLATGTALMIDESGRVGHTVPITGENVPEGGAATALFSRSDGVWVEVEHQSLVRIADPSGAPDADRPVIAGRFSTDGASLLRAAIDGPTAGATAAIVTADPLAASGASFAVRVPFEAPIHGILALDSDAAGRVYLAATTVVLGAAPAFDVVSERADVVVLGKDGHEEARVAVAPPSSAEEQLQTIRVGKDGAIYQLSIHDGHVTIERYGR